MKKIIILIITILSLTCLTSCKEEEKTLKVLLPQGTPLFSIGGLLDDTNFKFDIVNGQDPLLAGFTTQEYDIIIAPLNLGTKLYVTGKSMYKLEAIITTNNTYIISKNEINNYIELNDKTILAYGNGATPSLALNIAKDINNIEFSKIEYRTSVADVMLEFNSKISSFDYYLSAEPNITIMEEKTNNKINILNVMDLLETEINLLPQACLFVNPTSDIEEKTLKKIENNINFMNEKPKEYSQEIENKHEYFTTLTKNTIEKAIPNCNITYKKATENKNIIFKYYEILDKYQSKVLEGKRPDDSFFN